MMEPIVPVWFTASVTGLLLVLVIFVAYAVLAAEIRAHRRAIRKERLAADLKRRFETQPLVPYVMQTPTIEVEYPTDDRAH
jgi:hypothetical protein